MSQASSLIEPRRMHRFDQGVLNAYLERELEGYSGPMRVQQFEGGQSNPTFLLTTPSGRYVLRKKPPGKLLPSAHAVEREYRIYQALRDTDVPVPHTYLLAEDDSIVGTPFFVMEYMEGRVFKDYGLPGVSPGQRRAIYFDMIRVLASLHTVDYQAKGLSDYGYPGNYFVRQTGRWTKQYLASQTDEIDSMERLMRWLPENVPHDDSTSIVHGDFQLYNLMYHPAEPRCIGVLDWELSTLGNPLADLAYNCMKYHEKNGSRALSETEGIPGESEVVEAYCRLTGRGEIGNWNFCLAFSFFRMASIAQGVYKRGLQGNASSSTALQMKGRIRKRPTRLGESPIGNPYPVTAMASASATMAGLSRPKPSISRVFSDFMSTRPGDFSLTEVILVWKRILEFTFTGWRKRTRSRP